MLGFRKINGINIDEFNKRYDVSILNMLDRFIIENKLIVRDDHIFVSEEWFYKMNEILMELI